MTRMSFVAVYCILHIFTGLLNVICGFDCTVNKICCKMMHYCENGYQSKYETCNYA